MAPNPNEQDRPARAAAMREGIVLVTGAGGFTGGALARELARRGCRVRGTVRPGGHADAAALRAAGVDVMEADVGVPADMRRAVDGCRRVFHVAALFRRAGVPDAEYRRVNRDGTRYLLEAAAAAGVVKVVHCSTIGVCGDIANPPADETTPYNPGDIYQVTKMQGEQEAIAAFRAARPRGAVVRPASIYGPGDLRLRKLFRLIARRRLIVIGDGAPTFHTVYIDDLVEGFIRAMTCDAADGEVIILAGAEIVPLNDLFRLIAATLGVPPPRRHIPAWPVQVLSTLVERVCVALRVEPPIYRRRVDFFTKRRAFDIAKARRLLGYEPQVSLAEGIRRTAAWYQQEGLL